MDIKGILRVPCREQYSFIELHVEGTEEQIVDCYFRTLDDYRAKEKARNKAKEENEPPFDSDIDWPAENKVESNKSKSFIRK